LRRASRIRASALKSGRASLGFRRGEIFRSDESDAHSRLTRSGSRFAHSFLYPENLVGAVHEFGRRIRTRGEAARPVRRCEFVIVGACRRGPSESASTYRESRDREPREINAFPARQPALDRAVTTETRARYLAEGRRRRREPLLREWSRGAT